MIRGLYSAASALEEAAQQQEVLAENLAHLSTPGYRARGVIAESFNQALATEQASLSGVKVGATYTDFQPGSLRPTGGDFHLAIDGDGFFALETPQGTLYTRNGSFRLNGDGQVMSESGYPLLGDGGPISVPPDSGRVSIGRDGTVSAGGVPLGQIRLTRFENLQALEPVGPTLFAAPPDAGAMPAESSSVIHGMLESSNVNPAATMVQMIQAARSYEAAQRALRSIGEALQLNTRVT